VQTLSCKRHGDRDKSKLYDKQSVFCVTEAGKFHGGAEEVSRGRTREVEVSEDEDDDVVVLCVLEGKFVSLFFLLRS